VLTDDHRSPIQVLGLVESLVFREGIDWYIRLSPRFEVSQALEKGSPINGPSLVNKKKPTVRRRTAVCRPNQGGRSRRDSGKPIRVLLECVSCRSYPIEEQDVSDEW
jgi:hypothetical protein